MQRQDKPDGNDPPRPRPAAVVKGVVKAPINILPQRGAVQRGRRRVRTLMTPRRFRPYPLPALFSSSSDESDEESDAPSRGSLESMESADELGSLSESERSGSDFNEIEPYSPPDLEGEASEDKIFVEKPPVNNSDDSEESDESDEIPVEQDENEKPTEKSLEEIAVEEAVVVQKVCIPVKGMEKMKKDLKALDEIANKKAVLEQELRIPVKGMEKRKKDMKFPAEIADKKAVLEQELRIPVKGMEKKKKSPEEIADKEAVLKKELRIPEKGSKKKIKDLNQWCPSTSKEGAKVQPEPGPTSDAGPAHEPATKRQKKSE